MHVQVYELFDDLLLLSKGAMIYSGDAAGYACVATLASASLVWATVSSACFLPV